MNDLRLSPAVLLEVKRMDVDASTGVFTGFASTFDNIDSYGDKIIKGAFEKSLHQHRRDKTSPACLWAHDHTQPIGRWIDLKETSAGLEATGRLTLEVARAREAYALLKDGAVALSIGFTVSKTGASKSGSIREIREIDRLAEISLVSMPANPKAVITSTKARPLTSVRQAERFLRDVGNMSGLESKKAISELRSIFTPRDERAHDTKLDAILAGINQLQQRQRV